MTASYLEPTQEAGRAFFQRDIAGPVAARATDMTRQHNLRGHTFLFSSLLLLADRATKPPAFPHKGGRGCLGASVTW